MMMKDFDPDDEDDEELVKEVLDTAIVALEVDEARSRLSSFRSALSILKLLRSRIRNIKSLDYEKYPNHDEVCFFVVYSIECIFPPVAYNILLSLKVPRR